MIKHLPGNIYSLNAFIYEKIDSGALSFGQLKYMRKMNYTFIIPSFTIKIVSFHEHRADSVTDPQIFRR